MTTPDSDSFIRYMLLHDGFQYYEQAGISIDEYAAINITAIAGAKGGQTMQSFYVCPPPGTMGLNILSVLFHPEYQKLFVAFEYGADENYRPACCSTYVEIDMSQWW